MPLPTGPAWPAARTGPRSRALSGKKKKRARTQRREAERRTRRLVAEREKLVRLAPGGNPDRPIAVKSAAIVESRALSLGCHQCGGPLALDEHSAEVHGDRRLRVVEAACRSCGTRRTIYITLTSAAPN